MEEFADILTKIAQYVFLGFISVGTVLEVSKIKINPWSWIFKRIGKIINEELITRVDGLEKSVKDLEQNDAKNGAINWRMQILRFADDYRTGRRYTKEHWDEMLSIIDKYEIFCNNHPKFPNERTILTISYLKHTYTQLLKDNSFVAEASMYA